MIDENQQELQELTDEVEIILSVKDNISHEEIDNFVNKFNSLSEYNVRKKIGEITGDSTYIQNFIDKTNEIVSSNQGDTQNDTSEKIDALETASVFLEAQDTINTGVVESTMIEDKIQDKNIENSVFSEGNIPEVSFIKADIKYGQLSLEWGWPEGISKAIICYRMDRFPIGPTDCCASQFMVKREYDDEKGEYLIHKAVEGNYYFCIYISADCNGKTLYSDGQRRLVVNKIPSEIFYEIRHKKSLLGKLKGAEIVLSTTDKEINLPQLELVGKFGNMPLQKSDGKSILNIDYQTITTDKSITLNLPIENIGRNMYVKLFFLDDSNSKLYRIISPAKEKLYFK